MIRRRKIKRQLLYHKQSNIFDKKKSSNEFGPKQHKTTANGSGLRYVTMKNY